LESDVWLTADGVPVLDHDGVVWAAGRRRRVSRLERDELPDTIPSLGDLYRACGTDYELSLDVKDPDAAAVVVGEAGRHGAVSRLWLCHPDWRQVARWRGLSSDLHLVDSTRIGRIGEGPAQRAATLVAAGVDAVNLHRRDWSREAVDTFHDRGLAAFAWDVQRGFLVAALIGMGIDAVYSDHVEAMMSAMAAGGG
jgi:glycerophosphoryl diester phosphodiesterase